MAHDDVRRDEGNASDRGNDDTTDRDGDGANRRWILARRPDDEFSADLFELETTDVPQPGPNEVLVRTLYLSVDPYMSGRIRGEQTYSDPWPLGEPLRGRCVGEVVESNHPDFSPGETVFGDLHWAEYTATDGAELDRVDLGDLPASTALHVLGMPGRTAYIGLVEVGHVRPGDTVVVSAAAGAVGSVAGQIARIAGCRVVGIAGSQEKTDWLTDTLGFDEAIDYRAVDDLSAAVGEACPGGVDLYFENVGGAVGDAVTDHLADHSRIAVCGKIALYGDDTPPATAPRRMHQRTRTRVEGFLVHDYDHRFEEINDRLAGWVRDDEIRYRETVADGIERAPEAFLGLFEGTNVGKQLVRIAEA